jgi:hypothetical protein
MQQGPLVRAAGLAALSRLLCLPCEGFILLTFAATLDIPLPQTLGQHESLDLRRR